MNHLTLGLSYKLYSFGFITKQTQISMLVVFPCVGTYRNVTQGDEEEGADLKFRSNNIFIWLFVVLLALALLLVGVVFFCCLHERYKRNQRKYSVVDEGTVGLVGKSKQT